MKSAYLNKVLETVKARNPGEPEFLQAVTEVLLEIAHPVFTDGQHLGNAQSFRTEMSGQGNESAILVQVRPVDADERDIAGCEPEIPPPAAGRGQGQAFFCILSCI